MTLTAEEVQRVFVGQLFAISVVTVKTDRKQQELPSSQWYSVVREFRMVSKDAKILGGSHMSNNPKRNGIEASKGDSVPRSHKILHRERS
jgi:hypothetical protein